MNRHAQYHPAHNNVPSYLFNKETIHDHTRFFVKYSPLYCLNSNRIVSVEPNVWLGNTLENTKKMCDAKFNYSKDVVGKITQFSISQALYDCMTWDRYNLTLGLTLNVPTSLASNSKFVHQLASSVRYHRVNPQRVTVSIVANGPNHKDLPKNLATLNLLGFRLSLNNLGGKSANLSLLGDAKFSEVRLDESITTNIEHSRFNRKMTENLIMFAKSFGLDIVAPNNIYSQRKYTFSKLGVNYIQSNQASHQFTASQISESLSRTQYAS